MKRIAIKVTGDDGVTVTVLEAKVEGKEVIKFTNLQHSISPKLYERLKEIVKEVPKSI